MIKDLMRYYMLTIFNIDNKETLPSFSMDGALDLPRDGSGSEEEEQLYQSTVSVKC
jgi:hypothetical protein